MPAGDQSFAIEIPNGTLKSQLRRVIPDVVNELLNERRHGWPPTNGVEHDDPPEDFSLERSVAYLLHGHSRSGIAYGL